MGSFFRKTIMPASHKDLYPERSALILYGSETGTAQDVAEEVGQMTVRLHFTTKVVEMNSIEIVRRSFFTTRTSFFLFNSADSRLSRIG